MSRGREALERIDYEKMGGLVPVVVVDAASGRVLTLAFANREAVEKTLETGYAHFYSRTRRRLWMKGETSGNKLRVLEVIADCDYDSLLYLAVPSGPVCHTGRWSCFHNPLADLGRHEALWRLLVEAFREAKIVVRKGYGGLDEYLYVVNPVTDNIPPPDPLLVGLMAEELAEALGGHRGVDKVVSPEALGLPLASLVAQRMSVPLAVIRKNRGYPLPGLSVGYTSGYEEGVYNIYGVEPGERVAIVDDAVSSGGTLASVIRALEDAGVRVTGIAVGIAKPQYGGLERLESLGYRVARILDLYVERSGRLTLVDPATGAREELVVPVITGRGEG